MRTIQKFLRRELSHFSNVTNVSLQGLLGASRNDKTGEVEYMQFLQQLQEEDQFHRTLREPVSLQDKEYAAFLVQVCVCVLVFTTCMCVDVIHHNLIVLSPFDHAESSSN